MRREKGVSPHGQKDCGEIEWQVTDVQRQTCGWGIFPSHTQAHHHCCPVTAHYGFNEWWYVGRACRWRTKPRRLYIERLSRVGPSTPTREPSVRASSRTARVMAVPTPRRCQAGSTSTLQTHADSRPRK